LTCTYPFGKIQILKEFHMSNDLTVLQSDIDSLQPAFSAALVDQSINFQAEAGFAMQALTNNDYLCRVALANRQSLVDAVVNVAALGISLNPASSHAYLVPRDGRVKLVVSYRGLIHLATSTGAILWAQAKLVRESDLFELNGLDQQPTHKYNPFDPNRGNIVGAYCVAKLPNGDYITHPATIAEIYSSGRDRSEAWKHKQVGPWATDHDEMVRKTMVRQSSKYWGAGNERLSKAVQHLNADGEEGLAPEELSGSYAPEQPTGRKPSVAMPQSRSQAKPMRASPDAQDVDARPTSQQAQAPAKPTAADGTPCTAGELAWARKKVDALQPTAKAELEGRGFNVSGNLDGLTKGQFAALRKELV
jgi:recombination protein RecT